MIRRYSDLCTVLAIFLIYLACTIMVLDFLFEVPDVLAFKVLTTIDQTSEIVLINENLVISILEINYLYTRNM